MSDAASRPAGGCCRGPAADVPCGDPVVEAVVERLRSRSLRGRAKYGVGLDRSDLDLLAWLVHLQEELLDAAGYIQSAIRVIGKEMEDRRDSAEARRKRDEKCVRWAEETGDWPDMDLDMDGDG